MRTLLKLVAVASVALGTVLGSAVRDDSVLFDAEGSDVAVLVIQYTASWNTRHDP